MVLGVEATAERPDYARIPDVRNGWEAVRRTASEGRAIEEVRQRFEELRRAVWLSPDLVQADKKRIVEIFDREISDAGYDVAPPREMAALEGMPSVRPLRDADLLLGAPPAPRIEAGLEAVEAVRGPISMAELQRMMRDPDVPDAVLKQYFTASPATSRPFAPSIIPDPTRVAVAPPADAFEFASTLTEPGSSGSPVFDDQWRLIALHHAGRSDMPRLNGRPGTYEANEGINIHAIVAGLNAVL